MGRMLSAASLCLFLVFNNSLLPDVVTREPRPVSNTEAGSGTRSSTVESKSRIIEALTRSPLRFEENRGQADSRFKFISRGLAYTLLLGERETLIVLSETRNEVEPIIEAKDEQTAGSELVKFSPSLSDDARAMASGKYSQKPSALKPKTVRMELINSNPDPVVSGLDELSMRASYYVGKGERWATQARSFEQIEYKNIYDGIDLVYYGNQSELEYDFKVAPGADPKTVGLRFVGADDLRVERDGSLLVRIDDEEIRQHKPLVYQESFGVRTMVSADYLLKRGGAVGFRIGEYDPGLPLVIDPVVSFGTFLGGSGTDTTLDVATDSQGNTYLAGLTNSLDFPSTNGFQTAFAGGAADIFISKLNNNLSQLLYSTYIGGNGDDRAFGLDVDQAGNVYVTGFTSSANFPTINAMQGTFGGIRDAFALKLDGSGTLVYSTYIGRSGDDRGHALEADSSGNVFIAGLTSSTTFPMVNAFQSTFGGNPADAFVLQLNASGSALLYSTYLGGPASAQPVFGELVNEIRFDNSGSVYVTGFTETSSFPTKNALQSSFGGGTRDVFIAKFNPSRTGPDSLVYSTFLGGSDRDEGNSITVDAAGNAYVTGFTFSRNFPTAGAQQSELAGGADLFVSKVNSDGRSLGYSTYLGGMNNEQGTDIEVSAQGAVRVAGGTTSSDFPGAVALDGEETISPFAGEEPTPGFGFGRGPIQDLLDEASLSWRPHNKGADTNVNDIVVIEGDGTRTELIATDSGLFLHDFAPPSSAFVKVFTPGPGVTPTQVVFAGDTTYFAGFSGSAAPVWTSDGGINWRPSSQGLPENATVVEMGYSEFVGLWVILDNNKEYSSKDKGATWREIVYGGTSSGALTSLNVTNEWAFTTRAALGQLSGLYRSDGSADPALIGLINVQDLAKVDALDENVLVASLRNGRVGLSLSVNYGLDFSEFTDTGLSGVTTLNSMKYFRTDRAQAYIGTSAGAFLADPLVAGSAKPAAPHGVNVTSAQWNQRSNELITGSRFGETPILISLDGQGKNPTVGFVRADGNSFGGRIVRDRTDDFHFTGFFFNTNARRYSGNFALVNDEGIHPSLFSYQRQNRGGVDAAAFFLNQEPRINNVTTDGKRLIVEGRDFQQGARILVNDKFLKKTSNDPTTPSLKLIDQKGGKKIRPGQIVQVENPDSSRSNEFRF